MLFQCQNKLVSYLVFYSCLALTGICMKAKKTKAGYFDTFQRSFMAIEPEKKVLNESEKSVLG